MRLTAYKEIWAIPAIRNTEMIGALTRIPQFATGVILTLHVVTHLDGRYAMAGLITAISTVAVALASPWRGRLLDRYGLRRTILPSLLALPVVWIAAPFVSYWVLAALVAVGGILAVPHFSVMRQVMVANAPLPLRRTALALDSVVVELCFMVGPLLGVLSATLWDTRWTLLVFNLAGVLGNVGLWLLNPPIVERRDHAAEEGDAPARTWVSLPALAVLAAVFGAGFVLAGTDVAVVAGLRTLGDPAAIGWVMTLWSIGSAVGGFLYGAWHRSLPVGGLMAALALTTIPVAMAGSPLAMGLWLIPAGLFCAPSIAASVDALTDAVPVRFRGEAMGWHGSVITAGTSLSPPVVGWAMDVNGWQQGFWWSGAVGLGMAVIAIVGLRHHGRGTRDVAVADARTVD